MSASVQMLEHQVKLAEEELHRARNALTQAIRSEHDELVAARGRQLTPRQTEVLSLVRARKQNKEIAWDLHISERTVKFHVSRLLELHGVESRLDL